MLLRVPPSSGILRFLGSIALAFSGAVHAQETGVTGTMPEDLMPGLRPLIEGGLSQAPEMITQGINISISEAQRLWNGYGPLLPSLGGNAQYGDYETSIANNPQATSRTAGSFYSVTLTQPVFRWGALRNQLEVQQIGVLLSEKNFALGYLGFANSVRKQYEGLIITKMALRNSLLNLRIKQKAMDLATVQLKSGSIPQTSFDSAKLDLDSTQVNYDRDSQTYDFARHALAREVGVKDIPDDSIPLGIPPPKYSSAASSRLVSELLQTGARDTIQFQQGKLQVAQSELQYKNARLGLMPNFSAQASLQQWNQSNVQNGSVTQTALLNEQVSLQVNWTIFDGFETHGHKREALLRRRQAENDLEQTTDRILYEAQNSQRSVDIAWRQLQVTDRSFEYSTYSNQQQQSELKLGNISQDAADLSQYNCNGAEITDAQTRNGFLIAWCDFLSVVDADPVMNKLPASYARAKP
ncbi:MAG: TolC family protein [Opitutaceae bacterium]|jgi:outer membrane protein TolC